MVRRLTPDLLQTYDKIINDQLASDFIEEVVDDDANRGHYLSHRPVKRNSTTTPIRVVYDCSCRQLNDYPSLNDCLQTGPPLLNSLTAGLMTLRSLAILRRPFLMCDYMKKIANSRNFCG
ncbi:uncharacterized protein LOC102808933 [Saccoglossus kowalevskii]|uniref:Uncharacterized protein LOC102808933 n=1 Tax=Saccoglossus kowalevskii TaxID=10224 RepID=A0ABM0MS56_SACKO|nr:PREDICTED: uncharacterized protein LOC102808933 [Saccoglossus kowalevskii]